MGGVAAAGVYITRPRISALRHRSGRMALSRFRRSACQLTTFPFCRQRAHRRETGIELEEFPEAPDGKDGNRRSDSAICRGASAEGTEMRTILALVPREVRPHSSVSWARERRLGCTRPCAVAASLPGDARTCILSWRAVRAVEHAFRKRRTSLS